MIFDKHQETVDEILSRYPVRRSALLPLLNLAQKEEGYVSQAAMREIAGILDLTRLRCSRRRRFIPCSISNPSGNSISRYAGR